MSRRLTIVFHAGLSFVGSPMRWKSPSALLEARGQRADDEFAGLVRRGLRMRVLEVGAQALQVGHQGRADAVAGGNCSALLDITRRREAGGVAATASSCCQQGDGAGEKGEGAARHAYAHRHEPVRS